MPGNEWYSVFLSCQVHLEAELPAIVIDIVKALKACCETVLLRMPFCSAMSQASICPEASLIKTPYSSYQSHTLGYLCI